MQCRDFFGLEIFQAPLSLSHHRKHVMKVHYVVYSTLTQLIELHQQLAHADMSNGDHSG
jgi:hypothetical protein